MKLQICARCKKRPAMVFITRLENGKSINEGICMICANELGIKPVNDMLRKMGIDEEEIKNMSMEIDSLMENADLNLPDVSDDTDAGKTPTLNLSELFGMSMNPEKEKDTADKRKSDPKSKKESSKKILNTYGI
jgi:hypothetical protein